MRLTLCETGGLVSTSAVEAELVLVATGRVPNADRLDVAATGVATYDDGRIVVDDEQQTVVPGIWALGDVSSKYQLKHVANHEANVVRHNLLYPQTPIRADHRFVPRAIFSSPQIAAVGATEDQLQRSGAPYHVGIAEFGDTAYGWAMEDTTGFVKVLSDPSTGMLLGAHILGPQASTLIQPLVQAITFGLPAKTMASGQYWIHPALPEVIENALLALADA
jgi:mycothione reductase